MSLKPRRSLGAVTVLVRDYDEAIAWFKAALGFVLVEDTDLGGGKRWVLVAPDAGPGTCLLLARASTPAQALRVGDQTGGRVAIFLHTRAIMRRCGSAAFGSWSSRGSRLTGRSPCSRISTAIAGICCSLLPSLPQAGVAKSLQRRRFPPR